MPVLMPSTKQQAPDAGSVLARCRLDAGSMQARCRLSAGSIQVRCLSMLGLSTVQYSCPISAIRRIAQPVLSGCTHNTILGVLGTRLSQLGVRIQITVLYTVTGRGRCGQRRTPTHTCHIDHRHRHVIAQTTEQFTSPVSTAGPRQGGETDIAFISEFDLFRKQSLL
jgi:hypothetical protein